MNLKRAILGFSLSFFFLLFFVYMVSCVNWFFDSSSLKINKESLLGNISASQTIVMPEINAGSAMSSESNLSDTDKVVFEKNINLKLPIASLTKLMTAVIVLDRYDLSQIITVSKEASMQDLMKQDVKLGDSLSVENLFNIMLIKSSNKSAYALSEIIGEKEFVSLMNKKAKDLGLNDTFFSDPTGLDSKNISTANDLTKLAKYILKGYPKILDTSRLKEMDIPGFGKIANTDQLLDEIPEVICSKTGFTADAKGCLLLIVNNPKNNGYLINVILGADDRFLEMRKLINWSNEICK